MILKMVTKIAMTIFPTSLNALRITAMMPPKIPRIIFPITMIIRAIKPAVRRIHRRYTNDGRNHKYYNGEHQSSYQG